MICVYHELGTVLSSLYMFNLHSSSAGGLYPVKGEESKHRKIMYLVQNPTASEEGPVT